MRKMLHKNQVCKENIICTNFKQPQFIDLMKNLDTKDMQC
jgi:hypothetical protein